MAGAVIECCSSFARVRREGIFDFDMGKQARKILSVLTKSWIEIMPSGNIRNIAARLFLKHSLKAADCLQLSAAIIWTNNLIDDHEFVCFDNRLRDSALVEGFNILP